MAGLFIDVEELVFTKDGCCVLVAGVGKHCSEACWSIQCATVVPLWMLT
jgi:hypothetical protein